MAGSREMLTERGLSSPRPEKSFLAFSKMNYIDCLGGDCHLCTARIHSVYLKIRLGWAPYVPIRITHRYADMNPF